jgi:hypothetical protein
VVVALFGLLSVAVSTKASALPIPPVVVTPPPIAVVRVPPTPSEGLAHGVPKLTPEEAVIKAAAAYPRMVFAVFEFRVRRAEQVGPNFFLNSEDDYRDQRDLSIRILPNVERRLRERFGADLSHALLGHDIRVIGPAVRTRVDFIDDAGKVSGKYYYQTQVPVIDDREIEVLD